MSKYLTVLLLAFFVANPVFSQQENTEGDEDVYSEDLNTDEQEFDSSAFQGPLVYATGLFPDHSSLKVQLGGPVPVLMGIANYGTELVNISSLGGYFVHPKDPSFYIQNVTFCFTNDCLNCLYG